MDMDVILSKLNFFKNFYQKFILLHLQLQYTIILLKMISKNYKKLLKTLIIILQYY